MSSFCKAEQSYPIRAIIGYVDPRGLLVIENQCPGAIENSLCQTLCFVKASNPFTCRRGNGSTLCHNDAAPTNNYDRVSDLQQRFAEEHLK